VKLNGYGSTSLTRDLVLKNERHKVYVLLENIDYNGSLIVWRRVIINLQWAVNAG